jgi:hypothetical protein
MRVGLKHNGNLPRVQSVRDLFPRVEAFSEEVAKNYLDGLDFADLSLADLVENNDARQKLQEAQKEFSLGKKQEAFINLKLAFDILERHLPREVPLIREPVSLRLSGLPHELRRLIDDYEKIIGQLVVTTNMLALGIDPIKYKFFASVSPVVHWSVVDTYTINLWRKYDNIAADVFQTCFDFVVEFSLKISEVFRASSLSRSATGP